MKSHGLILGVLASLGGALTTQHLEASSNCENIVLHIAGEEGAHDSLLRFMKRDTALYMAAFLKQSSQLPKEGPESLLDLGCFETLSPALQAAVRASTEQGAPLDAYRLRKNIGEVFLETRHLRHSEFMIPDRLEDFITQTRFDAWSGQVVPRSRVKGLTRAIYHSPQSFPVEISVAVTHESERGDLNTPIRETEVIIRRSKDSNNWDFYAYDKEGQLQPHSEFRAGPRASPSVCMACHYEAATRAFAPLLRPWR